MSPSEIIFKKKLEKANIKFVHQYIFKDEICVDFAILEKKIIIEIDGPYHSGKQKIIDVRRDKFIKENGWDIIRIKNNEVEKYVVRTI